MKLIAVLSPLLLTASLFGQNQSPQQFVDKAAQIHMTEAHLGQMAQQKGFAQDVKEYGQKIESDHKDAYQKLKTTASGFTVPNGIDAEHQAVVNRFENLSGQQFDQKFRETMIQDHQKAIDTFQTASTNLQNDQLKTYASQLLPVLQNHLQMAQNLRKDVSENREAAPLDTARPLATSSSADRAATDTSATNSSARHNSAVNSSNTGVGMTHYATVTSYQPGSSIELKVRDRIGRHVYDLSKNQVSSPLPADLKVGSRVTVTEMVDNNGRRSIRIQNEQ